tara:strand:- start:184054 stop:185061 length:1008 start_codon:yes stop_codon:yes gene_type:complete
MILVTGGSGLVGSHLLFRLLEQGRKVRAIYRKGSDLKRVEKVFSYYGADPVSNMQCIDWVEADMNDLPALEMAFEGILQVYHCAAFISFDTRDRRQLYRANVTGTANIVNLCLAHNILKLCHVSSIATIGRSPAGQMAHEGNDWDDPNANVYALTKMDAELEVWRGSQENLSVVIVNPGVILGPGFWKSGSGSMFPMAAKEMRYYPPGGTGFVDVQDVVGAMIGLMESDIQAERFILVGHNITYGEIMGRLGKAIGKRSPTKQLPFWALELLWRLDRLYALITGNKRRLTKNNVRSFGHRELYSSQKVEKALDIQWTALDDSIRSAAGKFLQENP